MKNDYLFALDLFVISSEDFCSGYSRRTYYGSFAVGDEKNLVQLDGFTGFTADAVDVDDLAGLNFILFSTCFN